MSPTSLTSRRVSDHDGCHSRDTQQSEDDQQFDERESPAAEQPAQLILRTGSTRRRPRKLHTMRTDRFPLNR